MNKKAPTVLKNLAHDVCQLRQDTGLTQQQLADLMEEPVRTFPAHIEQARRIEHINIRKLYTLLHTLYSHKNGDSMVGITEDIAWIKSAIEKLDQRITQIENTPSVPEANIPTPPPPLKTNQRHYKKWVLSFLEEKAYSHLHKPQHYTRDILAAAKNAGIVLVGERRQILESPAGCINSFLSEEARRPHNTRLVTSCGRGCYYWIGPIDLGLVSEIPDQPTPIEHLPITPPEEPNSAKPNPETDAHKFGAWVVDATEILQDEQDLISPYGLWEKLKKKTRHGATWPKKEIMHEWLQLEEKRGHIKIIVRGHESFLKYTDGVAAP